MSREKSRSRVRRRSAAAIAVTCIALSGGAPAAVAEEGATPDPLWYMEKMRIPAIHEAGITGEGVTIAVFDSPINPRVAALADADIEVRDLGGCSPAVLEGNDYDDIILAAHGTSVTSLIVGNGTSASGAGPQGVAPGARILYYPILDGFLGSNCDGLDGNAYVAAMKDAVAEGADIVSFSGGHDFLADELLEESAEQLAEATRAGAIMVAALPNDTGETQDLDIMNGVLNVASVDFDARVATEEDGTPQTFEDVDVVAPGIDVAGVGFGELWGLSSWQGNSAATPMVSSLLALGMQKWPDASPEQLLQSLIRNTGSEPHELNWSEDIGYGVVNATRFIAEDPTQYPDENPLFEDGRVPTLEEAYGDAGPEADADAGDRSGDEATAASGTDGSALPMWLVVTGAVAVILAVVGAIVVPIAVVRSKRRKQTAPQDAPLG